MIEVAQKSETKQLSALLKVIAEPKRLEILSLLMQGTYCNCELGDRLNIAPNLISHHLRVIVEAGLIETERDAQDARWVYYRINPNAIHSMLQTIGAFFDISQMTERTPQCGPRFSPDQSKGDK